MKQNETPLLYCNRFYVQCMPDGTTRLMFGHSTNSEDCYHTGISMSTENASELAALIEKFIKESAAKVAPINRQQRRATKTKST